MLSFYNCTLQPGLGDVLLCLLGTLGATQQLLRATASLSTRHLSLGPWRGTGDAPAWAGELKPAGMACDACDLWD
jgi:hypothetical protein